MLGYKKIIVFFPFNCTNCKRHRNNDQIKKSNKDWRRKISKVFVIYSIQLYNVTLNFEYQSIASLQKYINLDTQRRSRIFFF